MTVYRKINTTFSLSKYRYSDASLTSCIIWKR